MPYFAAVFSRGDQGWTGSDIELDDVEQIDDIADLMRDSAGQSDDVIVLLLEENDEWCAIVRLDGHTDPQVFLSDTRAAQSSELAGLLSEAVGAEWTEEDEGTAHPPATEPAGATDIFADYGLSPTELTRLAVKEGMLPADVLTAVAERVGFAEELEQLR
ncbi:tRNA adenosine deaminase-associated protein [Allonocardiopsis opalescens]|uniref:Putative tRNA adenosine deaminase-associated protein n=1 Tax=Allonocardiopsis opalescens TaxID=1144618 RepID=A0A2T0Q6S3_9ACTN|nr:tRNA adenosine deaminase-associated protein [Allonocardiopsis opalescens]PRX99518.1 putative tRNA adenosine deaminase-associated protein [Allonocardiopsis opalescens]